MALGILSCCSAIVQQWCCVEVWQSYCHHFIGEGEDGDKEDNYYKSAKKTPTDENEDNGNDAALKSDNRTVTNDEDGDKDDTGYKSAKKTAADQKEGGGASKKDTDLKSKMVVALARTTQNWRLEIIQPSTTKQIVSTWCKVNQKLNLLNHWLFLTDKKQN